MKKRKSFWLSYDMGLKGDNESLFSFLDTVGATECVSNLAYFTYECHTDDYPNEIKNIIKDEVKIDKNDRFYLIWKDEAGAIKGRFLFGGRKRSPWEGFGRVTIEDESDTAE
jgi:hypothetical protein